MRIGGFIKQSFIDWNGLISAVVFTKGCNFRCGYCHNPHLVLPSLFSTTEDISEINIFEYLEKWKHLLDGVVISGGEPTIHADLRDFIIKVKSIGLKVKLDTNGTNPDCIKQLTDLGLLDAVSMDIKNLLNPGDYSKVTNIHDENIFKKVMVSINILSNASIDVQFRTTILPGIHSADIIEKLESTFQQNNYLLQDFRNGEVLDKIPFFEEFV